MAEGTTKDFGLNGRKHFPNLICSYFIREFNFYGLFSDALRISECRESNHMFSGEY
jgi:hypothetical protein